MQDVLAEKLTERYNREAYAYRDLWGPVLRTAGVRLLAELGNTPIHRIVDVGTGVGSLLPDLHSAFPDALLLGVDRAEGMLKLAPREVPLAVMDARQLGRNVWMSTVPSRLTRPPRRGTLLLTHRRKWTICFGAPDSLLRVPGRMTWSAL